MAALIAHQYCNSEVKDSRSKVRVPESPFLFNKPFYNCKGK